MTWDKNTDIHSAIEDCQKKIENIRGYLDLPAMRLRLEEIEKEMSQEHFWENPDHATTLLKERSTLASTLDSLAEVCNGLEEAEVLLELAEEEEDSVVREESARRVAAVEKKINAFSLELMLSEPDDGANAIVSINAGAGGTDSQDWAEMLLRMYSRWVEHQGYKLEMVDVQPGEEAGIKSATFKASGKNAYGYLKNEVGVHRLVRISPFNASGKRHTSFSSVFVYPEIDNDIEIDIDDGDLRVDVFRASGAGGQHVNKTSSAVRITHLPSNIVVQCQQEKSQSRNKEIAMNVLRSRLYQAEKLKQEEKARELHESKEDISWGSQIRSYVLHPYQKVKDHRVDLEIGDVNSVLDGHINPFIDAVLSRGNQ
ncbi:MAG: peptide chain release factor 2 [Desulfosudaceae bacterium]